MVAKRKYEACRPVGVRHGGRPFTCRACGKRACWECALRHWPERALPQSSGGLTEQRAAIDAAEREGRLLGCCSRACRAKLPRSFSAEFRLETAVD